MNATLASEGGHWPDRLKGGLLAGQFVQALRTESVGLSFPVMPKAYLMQAAVYEHGSGTLSNPLL